MSSAENLPCMLSINLLNLAELYRAVGSASDSRYKGYMFKYQLAYIISIEIDHGIISAVILPFTLIKKGSCQLLAKVCAQVLV